MASGVNVDGMNKKGLAAEWTNRAMFALGHISERRKRKTLNYSYSEHVQSNVLENSSSVSTGIVDKVKKGLKSKSYNPKIISAAQDNQPKSQYNMKSHDVVASIEPGVMVKRAIVQRYNKFFSDGMIRRLGSTQYGNRRYYIPFHGFINKFFSVLPKSRKQGQLPLQINIAQDGMKGKFSCS